MAIYAFIFTLILCTLVIILDIYTNSWNIETIKTGDFGPLFEIHYIIHMKLDVDQKKFIDELIIYY